MVAIAPIGSTMPESTPPAKDFPRPIPAEWSGMEMIAPSGKFWIAIPRESAMADAAVMLSCPDKNPA